MNALTQLDRQLQPHVRALEHRKRRSVRGLLLTLTLMAFGTSGVAYAAIELWRPVLGNNPDSRPVAVEGDLPAWLTQALPVLAREQTAQDRDAAAQFALTISGTANERILTASVRRVGETSDGQPVTLIPVLQANDAVELCLAVGTARDGNSSKACLEASALNEGRLMFAYDRIDASKEAREAYDRQIVELLDKHPTGPVEIPRSLRPPPGSLKTVGLAPTTAPTVTYADGQTVDVNTTGLFEGTIDERSAGGKLRVALAR